MEDTTYLSLQLVERQLAGLPPPKEIVLSPDAVISHEEAAERLMKLYKEIVSGSKSSVRSINVPTSTRSD